MGFFGHPEEANSKRKIYVNRYKCRCDRYRDKRRRVVLDKVSAYGACLIHASNMNDEPETQLHLIGVGGYFFNKKILAMRVLRALLVLCQWWRV